MVFLFFPFPSSAGHCLAGLALGLSFYFSYIKEGCSNTSLLDSSNVPELKPMHYEVTKEILAQLKSRPVRFEIRTEGFLGLRLAF